MGEGLKQGGFGRLGGCLTAAEKRRRQLFILRFSRLRRSSVAFYRASREPVQAFQGCHAVSVAANRPVAFVSVL